MIKQINIQDIPKKRRGAVIEDIKRFLESNDSAAEVVVLDGRRPESVLSTYKTVVARKNYAVKVIQRNKRVFLIRKDYKNES